MAARKWLTGVLGIGLAGCGLSDYEARMLEGQRRFQKAEEANRLLDQPVQTPYRKEKDKYLPIANLFFRPPRGIGPAPDQAPRHDLLYTYRPRIGGSAGSFIFVELAFGTGKKDFSEDVLRFFSPQGKPQTLKRNFQAGDSTANCDATEFEEADGKHISINVFQTPTRSVAVVYWVVAGQKAAAAPALLASLQSFGLDVAAAKMQAEYNTGGFGKR